MISLFHTFGPSAGAERDLTIHMVLIMLIIVLPVFILVYVVAFKYRIEDDADSPPTPLPEKPHSKIAELSLWILPIIMVGTLWTLTWPGSHNLDPYKPIDSKIAPITIQVIALPWKWLFIYPAQNIATVNYVVFPEKTPVHFELTADGPISSFWIPQLGTQIYAMAAMETQLYTLASSTGEFVGKDTEINGDGYSGMLFTAKSVSQIDFNTWVTKTTQPQNVLDRSTYEALAKPSQNNKEATYSSVSADLFNTVIMKFMMPAPSAEYARGTLYFPLTPGAQIMPGMDMMPGMKM